MSKTVVVTGASRGIGRAIAIALSEREDLTNFILISRTEEGLVETSNMMNLNKNIQYFSLDLTDYDAVRQLIQRIGEEYKTIDMLINVAVYANPKSLLETSIDDWEKTYNIN